MKTKNFFFAAIVSVVAPVILTSCMKEEKGDLDQMSYEYTLKKQVHNKQIETLVEVGENIADLYDYKVTYEMDGKTVVEDLRDMNETKSVTQYSLHGEPNVFNVKLYSFSKYAGKAAIKMTITATPKADAMARVEAMPEDARFNYVFNSKTTCDVPCEILNHKSNTQYSLGAPQVILMKRLAMGELTLETGQYK